jgi:Protein of unknown function (DUF1036)
MLKTVRLLSFISLITTINIILFQPVVSASTVFCNKTNAPIRVAYARGTFNPTLSIEMTSYEVKGWLKIAPATCITASTEPADKVNLPNSYDLVHHYYYAKSINKNIALMGENSPRTENFCIKDTNFKYTRELGDTSPKLKCDSPKAFAQRLPSQRLRQRGYRQVSFTTFNSNTPNYTVLLTSPQSLPRK